MTTPQPLQDRRIVITRSQDQADALAALIAARGGVPILVPVIRFVRLEGEPQRHAFDRLPAYDWLILTSVNGVQFFFDRLAVLSPAAKLPPIAVVGSATADALRERGIEPDFMPDTFTGVDLVAGLGDLESKRVLLPRSRKGRPEIAEAIVRRGARLDDIALYDTVPAEPDPSQLAEIERGVDAILFTSPSSVRHFYRLTGEPARRRLNEAVVACIGPTTAEAARHQGYTVRVVPPEFTIESLLEALSRHFEENP